MEPLKEGESICPVCNGSGESRPGWRLGVLTCKKCRGHGKLDWVEMIVGKRGSWCVRPEVFVQTKLSDGVPSFEQDIKEIRESIIEACGIPPSYLGIKT